ncbi:hypothetical protein [Streptomyces sp. NPDC059828]
MEVAGDASLEAPALPRRNARAFADVEPSDCADAYVTRDAWS